MEAVLEDHRQLERGLRARLEIERERRREQPLEPISPELVLVAPPELASDARALLPDLPGLRWPAAVPSPRRPLSRERAIAEIAAVELLCVFATVGPLLLVILAR